MASGADLRRLALSLHGVTERPHFDRAAFRVARTFCTLAADERSANFNFAPDEQALKCTVAPDAFVPIANKWGQQGWTIATLAALSEAELAAALEMAYRHALPRPAKRRR